MKRNFLTLGILSVALAACSGGENGQNGKDGKDGGSCHVADNGDGSATITCPDGTSFTVKNGEKGKKGDAGSDGESGENGKDCYLTKNLDGSAAVVCPADGSSFIVRGNPDNYTNYCAPGFYGKNCENECNCNENRDCNDGVTGDGSCTCKPHRTGQDCADCADNFYGNNCENECSCNDHQQCNDGVTGDGSCSCKPHRTGQDCADCVDGFYGNNCENECPVCGEHGNCNDGVTGDGSCICLDGWSDVDCSVCPAGFYNVENDCFDCRKGSTAFGTEKCTLSDKRTDPATIYRVVTIGNQTWMAENLKAELDVNGNEIKCYANTDKDTDFVENYGCLYVWKELAELKGEIKPENTNRICPQGWRLPTKTDFDNLLTYVTNNRTASSNFYALIKESTAWNNYSNQEVDDFGFGALPAGYRNGYGDPYRYGERALFWSATPYENTYFEDYSSAYYLGVWADTNNVIVNSVGTDQAYSVRCIKD